MRRAHLYAIVLGLGMLGLSGTAVILGLWMLLVPGLLLLVAPTAALYLPLADAICTSARRRRWVVLAFALALGVMAFIVVPNWVNTRLASDISSTLESDFGTPDAASPGRLFLVAGTDRNGAGACGPTCARLLVEERVQEVVVPLALGGGESDLTRGFAGPAAIYRLRPSTVCSPLPEDQLDADRDVLARIGAGACIVQVSAEASDFDTALVVRRDEQKEGHRMNPFAAPVRWIERRSVWRCRAVGCEKTLHQTTVEAGRLLVPISIGLGTDGSSIIREINRVVVTANPVTSFGVLGLPASNTTAVRPASRLSTAEASRVRQVALTVLDATTRTPRALTSPETVLVNEALAILRDQPGSGDDDYRLLRATLAHPRLNGGVIFPNIFELRPTLRDTLAPDLVQTFDRLTHGGQYDQAEHRRQIAREIARMSDASFLAHQTIMLQAAARPFALVDSGDLPTRLGDYGDASLPLLTEALSDPSLVTYRVILGLCRIGRNADPLAARLAILQRSEGESGSWDTRAAALALIRMGRADLIKAPPRHFLRGRQSRELHAWYGKLNSITPRSPVAVCAEAQISLSH